MGRYTNIYNNLLSVVAVPAGEDFGMKRSREIAKVSVGGLSLLGSFARAHGMELNDRTIKSESHVTLEDALIRTGFGKFSTILVILTGSILGCVVLETVSINFILPVAQCDLDLTTHDKGVLSAIGFVGMIVSSHLWGFLADTKGRKAVIVPTLLMAFVMTLISSFAKSFWFLVLMRFLNGFL